MRSRKSPDSGAGMTSPPTHQNRLPRISIPDSAQHKSALVLKEHGIRFSLRGLREKQHVSWPFQGSASAEGELSWEITTGGRPRPGNGCLRYPITYPVTAGALSGYGFHIAAPFASNQARHAPAAGDPVNQSIIERAADVAARILARHLVPHAGPDALSVIHPSSGSNEHTAELVVAVGRLGGLPIAVGNRNKRPSAGLRGGASRPGTTWRTSRGPLVFPHVARGAPPRWLSMLVPDGLHRLHPDVPRFVIDTFAAGGEPGICRPFRPADAIDRMCGTSQQFPWRSDKQREEVFSDPDRVADYLKLLSAESATVRTRADDIKKRALLPISGGGTGLWSTVEWAISHPPEVPGASAHIKIIHPKLRSTRLLQRGLLKLSRFNLDRRLVNLVWDKVLYSVRERYLRWLVANARRLKPATLASIARHPVFEASDGSYHPLGALCLIREPNLRRALASHIKMPSATTQSLIASRRAVLKLRSKPSVEECRAWYAEAFSQIAPVEGQVLDRQAIRNLDQLEQVVQLLLQLNDPELLSDIKDWDHRTASKTGHLRPVYCLHLPTDAVAACQLSPEDLLGRRPIDIWETLGAREHPSDEAILRVIADGAPEVVFYRRLATYLKEGGNPGALTELPCIRTPAGMKAASSVAIAGKTSFWGRWKTTIKVGVPERARHLELIGVLRTGLREHDSRAFFEWLARQDPSVQFSHRDEIRRHWYEPAHGPIRWWEAYQDVLCLPIIAGGKLLLISHAQATARPVYLPDFPDIAKKFARIDTRHGVVDESIHRVFPDLRDKGIRSLRDTLISRGRTTVQGPRGLAENRHQETVRVVQIGANRRTLARELDRVGLGRKSLLPECMKVLEQLTEARCAEKIVASYKIGGTTYETEVAAALGEDHVLWMADAASDMAPFEAIAHRLVRAGDEAAPYKFFLAVQHLRAGIGPLLPLTVPEPESEADRAQETGAEDGSPTTAPPSSNGSGGTASGHATPMFKEPAVPNPTPFPHATPADFAATGKRPSINRSAPTRTPATGSTSERRNTVLEEIEKTQLKRDNYGFHCQACLGSHQPKDLTPKFTYLWDDEYRSRRLEAHHVAHLQNYGGLGAGNLIILCEYHHDFLGDRLDRQEIVQKLKTAKKSARTFGERRTRIAGRTIDIELDVPPYKLALFFTETHAAAWMERAQDFQLHDGDVAEEESLPAAQPSHVLDVTSL
jgi:hypothetical protein